MINYQFKELKDQVCVITGGTGVIGSCLLEGLARCGVKTAVISRQQEKAERLAQELSQKYNTGCIGVYGDVVNKNTLEDAKKIINKKLGKINFLINCAGGNSPDATTKREFINEDNYKQMSGTFFGLDLGEFKHVHDLNFMGTVTASSVFAADMILQKKGAIINISSMSAYRPLTKIPAYSAAKSGVNNFTQWLAVHLAKVNVRVNALAPGFFLTAQNRFLLIEEKSGNLTERGKKIIQHTPMEKFGDPEDLTGSTLFLLSDMARFITGVILPVDGGFNAFSGV